MNIAQESLKLIKKNQIRIQLCCPAPPLSVSCAKKQILILGLNPAGGANDAARDRTTNGLFLNYYREFENNIFDKIKPAINKNKGNINASQSLIYKNYFNPILETIEDVVGRKNFEWEWCSNIVDTCDKIRKLGICDQALYKELRNVCNIYKNSDYQVIVRDLVYYHQTSDFKKLLKPETDKNVKIIVKGMIDDYIKNINENGKLRFIYVNNATASHYVLEALSSQNLLGWGGLIYKDVPIILGSMLSGQRAMDVYSRERLKTVMKQFI